jgi:hypothetical protein
MPSIGSNIPVLTGAANYPLPERYMAALRANVRFFILRYPKYVYTDQRVMGAFDVRCREENLPGAEHTSFDMRWLTGVSAGVTYYTLTEGLAIAHMPDDIYFHNRVLLLTHPWMLTASEGVLTREGVLAASQLHVEVQCMREVLWEPREIFRIVRENGGEVNFQWTREDAQRIIDSSEKRTINRTSVIDYKPYEKCHIEVGQKITWKPRFEQMIRQYARAPYGWTACPEFKDEVIPHIAALVRQRLSGSRPSAQALDMEAMYAQFKDRMMKELQNGKSPDFVSGSPVELSPVTQPVAAPQQQAAPQSAPVQQPTAQVMPSQVKTTYTKSKLHPMNKTELRDLGATMGVALDINSTKELMIAAILNKQEEGAPVVR